MSAPGSCPRCGSELRAPGLMTSAWQCPAHGEVLPLHVHLQPSERALGHLAATSRVPVWVPLPLPARWLVSGSAWVGDERSGAVAAVVALSGPAPLGGPGDLLVVSEEPGIGLGARLAGLDGPDAGETLAGAAGVPAAKVRLGRHSASLWNVEAAPDRWVVVGEAEARWLWLICWPAQAELLSLELTGMADLRSWPVGDLAFGAATPRLLA